MGESQQPSVRTFSLRGLLLAMACVAILAGWLVDRGQIQTLSRQVEAIDDLFELRLSQRSLVGRQLSDVPEIELLADGIYRPGQDDYKQILEVYELQAYDGDTLYFLTPTGHNEGSFYFFVFERNGVITHTVNQFSGIFS